MMDEFHKWRRLAKGKWEQEHQVFPGNLLDHG